jgi:hypothetical protein
MTPADSMPCRDCPVTASMLLFGHGADLRHQPAAEAGFLFSGGVARDNRVHFPTGVYVSSSDIQSGDSGTDFQGTLEFIPRKSLTG